MPDSQSGAVAAFSRRTLIQAGLATVVVSGLNVGRSAADERREENWPDRRTPDAAGRQLSFAFRKNAEGFYRGAVASHERFPDISLHSLAIAIELSLKAYLLHRGVSDDWNRVHIGHDLCRALACAKRVGLRSTPGGLPDLASGLILSTALDRRQERAQRRGEHVAELGKKAAEASARLKRLCDAIESRVADLDDPSLKDRITELKAIRDQAQADAQRAQAAQGHQEVITPARLHAFAEAARRRLRGPQGGYRRDHLRALAQRVEVADGEVRIVGSKSQLLRTLAASQGALPATGGVPTSVLNWR